MHKLCWWAHSSVVAVLLYDWKWPQRMTAVTDRHSAAIVWHFLSDKAKQEYRLCLNTVDFFNS